MKLINLANDDEVVLPDDLYSVDELNWSSVVGDCAGKAKNS